MKERVQKILSAAGICSRRAAESLIREGRVTVNGTPAALGTQADPTLDRVCVDGREAGRTEKPVCLMLNKPRGYVTTLSDERGRPTVAELVQDCGVRVYPVGRLDLMSEGLLLLTNDGALTQSLLHPKFEVRKTYLLSVAGPVRGAAERMRALTDLDGETISPAEVSVRREGAETAELVVVIHEGKNRQIRRMCAACGLRVKRLERIGEHSLTLGNLESGRWRFLTDEEIQILKNESDGKLQEL